MINIMCVKSVFFRLIICFLFLMGSSHADSIDGDWALSIKGKDNLEFGTQFLAGGLILNWTTTLLFSIKDGQFVLGTGLAELSSNITSFSRPENLIKCKTSSGTYVSQNGQIFKTPHLRYIRFPVSGQAQLKKMNSPIMMKLVHGMEYPGNYYGVLFECKTKDGLGQAWLDQGPKVSKEKASRQSIETQIVNGFYIAKVKQVKAVAPGPELIIPMINHWQMTLSDSFGESTLQYQLTHKKKVNN